MEEPTEWPYDSTWDVHDVTYVAGEEGAPASLVLTVARGTVRHRLTFRGVENLRFEPRGSNFPYALQVSSVADRQLENLRYKATTRHEFSTLEFYCADAEATLIDNQ